MTTTYRRSGGVASLLAAAAIGLAGDAGNPPPCFYQASGCPKPARGGNGGSGSDG